MFDAIIKATALTKKTLAKIGVLPGLWRAEIGKVIDLNATRILNRVVTYSLTGGVLRVQTGNLRSRVTRVPAGGVTRVGNSVFVKIGTNVFYGKAWEEGFHVPERVASGRAMAFMSGGKKLFRKRLPPRTQEARPWLGPGFQFYKPVIRSELSKIGGKLT